MKNSILINTTKIDPIKGTTESFQHPEFRDSHLQKLLGVYEILFAELNQILFEKEETIG